MDKIDFEDGRGEVAAHQHINRNGDTGGWVEENCEVSETSYVSVNSRVDNNSSVDNSSVEKLKINHTKRVYSQSPIGSRADRCSAILGVGETEIIVMTGCFRGTIEEFRKKVMKTHGHNNYGKEYLAFVQNAKAHFEIWQTEFTAAMPELAKTTE